MSVSQEEFERVLAAWLCAGCYGRNFTTGYDSGVTSEIDVQLTKHTNLALHIEDEDGMLLYTLPTPMMKRDITKHSHYKHEFFDAHGIINGFDTVFASYWGHYFADLRNNLISYYHEVSGYGVGTSGDHAIGRDKLAYGGWYGGKDACMRINMLDAIAMPLVRSKVEARREHITLGDYTPYEARTTEVINRTIAASDRSGYSGGVAFDTFHWGDYEAIDETKPHDCNTGEYQVLAEREQLDLYSNSWDNFGSYHAMDEYDESVWNNAYNGGMDKIDNGTYDYPNFVQIDLSPRGSWAMSVTDKHFYSQKNRDNTYFVKLDGDDPETKVKEFFDDTQNTYTTYFPVAPV
jgi:hypothetical protein